MICSHLATRAGRWAALDTIDAGPVAEAEALTRHAPAPADHAIFAEVLDREPHRSERVAFVDAFWAVLSRKRICVRVRAALGVEITLG